MTAMNEFNSLENFGSNQVAKHKVDNSMNMLDSQVDIKEKKNPLKLVFKKFHCQYCDYFAENSDMFEIHQVTHINRRLNQCCHGEVRFTQKTNLLNHVKNNLVNHEKANLVNNVKSNLENHKKTNLVNHDKTHTTGEIVYQCSICDKSFSNKGSLVRHRGLHQGINKSEQFLTCRRYRLLFNFVGGVIKTEDTCR